LKVHDSESAAAKASIDVGGVLSRPVEAYSSLEDESSATLEVSTEDVTSEKAVSVAEYGPLEKVAVAVVVRAAVVGRFVDVAEFTPPVGFGTGSVLISCLGSVGPAGPIEVVVLIEVEVKFGPRGEAVSIGFDSMSTLREILLR